MVFFFFFFSRQISIPSEGVYRQAAVTSMLSALYLEQATPAALVAQAAFFAGRGNATCFVPQTTIAFSQSRNVCAKKQE